MKKKISIVGSGSWGVALAILLNNNGYDPYIWSFSKEEADSINEKRECVFLPGIKLDENIKLIGIANNNMLGVFQLVKIDGGYECHRIYIEGDTVIVSDFGYPVSNMGNVRASLDCDMEYILPIATLSSL